MRDLRIRLAALLVMLAAPAFATNYFVDGSTPSINIHLGGANCEPVTRLSGTVQAGSDTTHIVLESDACGSDNTYRNYGVMITSGSLRSVTRRASAYTGSSKTITLATAMGSDPTGLSYRIVNGSDTNDGSTSNVPVSNNVGPFATVNKAANTAIGGTHTVKVAAATYDMMDANYGSLVYFDDANANATFVGTTGWGVTDDPGVRPTLSDAQSSNAAMQFFGSSTGKVTFNGFNILSNNPTSTIVNNCPTDLRLINCNVVNSLSAGVGIVLQGTGTSSTDLSMEGGSLSARGYLTQFKCDVGSIGFEGPTFLPITTATIEFAILPTPATTNGMRVVDMTSFRVERCVFDPTVVPINTPVFVDSIAKGLGIPVLNGYGTLLRFADNTGSIGRLAQSPGRWRNVEIVGNELTFTDQRGLLMGLETDGGAATVNTSGFGRILVADNDLTFSAADANHNLFFGIGAGNVQMINNVFTTPSSSSAGNVVIKSDYNTLYRNTIYADMATDAALYVAGGANNTIVGNTIVAADTSAITIDTNQDGTNANYNYVAHNILQGSTAYMVDPAGNDSDANTWANVFENNLLWSSGTNIIDLGGTDVTRASGIAGVQSAWLTYCGDNTGAFSDGESLVANPRFINAAQYDFRLRTSSPAWSLGAGAQAAPSAATHRMGLGM
jgi:hypothetical protein